MNAHPKKSWILSEEVTEAVQRLIDEGRVSGLDEVVQIALGVLLDEPDLGDTEWLRQQVQPVLEELERDPSRAIPMEQVFAELRAHHAKRLAEG